ncbi:hypothetical protein JN27_01525 [Massilia sp. BSC265]|nr:hypothetical protein JN27_01525 [Massilia sp. BSC265]
MQKKESIVSIYLAFLHIFRKWEIWAQVLQVLDLVRWEKQGCVMRWRNLTKRLHLILLELILRLTPSKRLILLSLGSVAALH